MSFATGVANWIASLSEQDSDFVASECNRRKCMFGQVIAGQKVNNVYLTDWQPAALTNLRREIRNNDTLIAAIDCVLFLKDNKYV